MPDIAINVVAHDELTASDFVGLRRLFDAEYQDDFGEWNPDRPYGYAPHVIHVFARRHSKVVGHVGWARRTVGGDEIEIAGVGGVLISDNVRGERAGSRLMGRAAESMKAAGGIGFGYLGCREEVVPFTVPVAGRRFRRQSARSIDRVG